MTYALAPNSIPGSSNRIYQQLAYGVDPSTGTVGNALISNMWYGPSGNTLQQIQQGDGGVLTKSNSVNSGFEGKSIILVGNREPARDLSKAIDSYDFVFRFSYLRFIKTGLVGNRTDGVYLEATHGYRQSLANGPAKFCNSACLRNVKLVVMRRMWYSIDVLRALDLLDRNQFVLEDWTYPDIPRPTSGFRLIMGVLTLPLFSGARLSICAFTTDVEERSPELGWHDESLVTERIAVRELIDSGRIVCID